VAAPKNPAKPTTSEQATSVATSRLEVDAALGSAFANTSSTRLSARGRHRSGQRNRQGRLRRSDAPMSTDPDTRPANGCAQIRGACRTTSLQTSRRPTHLRLQRPAIANTSSIGHITNWNDPAIAELNPARACKPERSTPSSLGRLRKRPTTFSDYLSALVRGSESSNRRLDPACLPQRRWAQRLGLRRGVVKKQPPAA